MAIQTKRIHYCSCGTPSGERVNDGIRVGNVTMLKRGIAGSHGQVFRCDKCHRVVNVSVAFAGVDIVKDGLPAALVANGRCVSHAKLSKENWEMLQKLDEDGALDVEVGKGAIVLTPSSKASPMADASDAMSQILSANGLTEQQKLNILRGAAALLKAPIENPAPLREQFRQRASTPDSLQGEQPVEIKSNAEPVGPSARPEEHGMSPLVTPDEPIIVEAPKDPEPLVAQQPDVAIEESGKKRGKRSA